MYHLSYIIHLLLKIKVVQISQVQNTSKQKFNNLVLYSKLRLSQHRVTRHIVLVGPWTKIPIICNAFPQKILFLSWHLQVVISLKSACFSQFLFHKTTKIPLCTVALKRSRFGIGFLHHGCDMRDQLEAFSDTRL